MPSPRREALLPWHPSPARAGEGTGVRERSRTHGFRRGPHDAARYAGFAAGRGTPRRVRARRCAWSSPRHLLRAGCRDCFPRSTCRANLFLRSTAFRCHRRTNSPDSGEVYGQVLRLWGSEKCLLSRALNAPARSQADKTFWRSATGVEEF
jgi:hypothetical protein